MDTDSVIAAIAARQLGLFTRAQSRAAGATRSMTRHRLRRGRWVQVHADVFRLAGAPSSWEQSLRAACLAAGPVAVVSHRAAAQVWELPGVRPDVELTLPFGHDALLGGVRVHHSRSLPPVDVGHRDGLQVTTPTRTLIDLSAVLDRSALQQVLDHCLGQRLTTASFVARRLDSLGRPGRAGSALLSVLVDNALRDRRQPESELERRLWDLLVQLPGPRPVAQYEVRLPGGRRARLDIAYPDIRLGIEADSYVHHASPSDWASDHTRRNALIAAGWRVLPVTWDDVSHDPEGVLELVRRARGAEGGRPRLTWRATSRYEAVAARSRNGDGGTTDDARVVARTRSQPRLGFGTLRPPVGVVDLRAVVAAELDDGRRRSLELLAPLPDSELVRQHSPIMSPLVWDLAHVGNYEELWLLRAVAGAPPIDASLDDLYDAFRHPRPNRPALPLLPPPEARHYIAEVRGRVLDVLERVELDDGRPLLAGGFVYGMVIQHEHQHDETMLATLQLMDGDGYRPLAPAPPEVTTPPPRPDVRVPGGPFVMGTDDDAWAYDNERPAHIVDVPAFWIDTAPVTNGQYLAFVDDGGYDDPRWWTEEGWTWRRQTPDAHAHPEFWRRTGPRSWSRRRFGFEEDLPPDEPVQHVCWHEATAYAAWAGKRLPTEAEWEKAASWTADGHKRRYPWGDDADDADSTALERANLGQRHFRPAPVGAYPGGASPWGAHQLVGDVWEWTSSDFVPYPGFRSFPYPEYSEVFYGYGSGSGYKVLRGGSWATAPCAVRTTFRNWDYPIRRQIFAGFRCARDDA